MTNAWLGYLRRYPHAFLALGLVLLAAGLALRFSGGDSPAPLVFEARSSLPDGTPIRVHVAGAVVSPGVYEMKEGDRLVDALEAAGGPNDEADANALNLARRVRDEEQVLVPAKAGAREAVVPLAPGERLDINTATAAMLDQLPGIGEAYSRRIVDSRAVDGAFRSIEELVERRVIPRATFDQVREQIFVAP